MADPTRRTVFTESLLHAIKLGLPLSFLPVGVGAAPRNDSQLDRTGLPGADDVTGAAAVEGAHAAGARVGSIADLKALTSRPPIVFAAGYRSPGDGGGGLFFWSPGSSIKEDILSVAPTKGPLGRYVRHGGSTINVMWAGASGRGDVDDTPAFRAALAAGSTVFVPPGLYNLTDTLHLDGATIFGAGPHSILKCGSPGFNLFEVAGSGARIERLTIWGGATDQMTAQFGIVTSTSSPPEDMSISDVRFSGPDSATGLNNGIKFEDHAKNCRIQNNHFERLIGAARNGYGILTGTVDGLLVTGNTFQGSRSAGQGRHAVYVSAAGRRVVVSNNIVREFNFEALTTNAYAYHEPVEELIFADNVVYRCGGDGSNQSSICVGGRAKTVRVEGNIVIESFGCGILCDAGSVVQENIAVDGNTIIDANYFGIRQVGALQQAIRNNYVRGSSRKTAQTWPDIVVGSGGIVAPEQILVSGNQCVPVPGISCRAFVLNATQPLPAAIKVTGNDFPTSGYFAGPDYAPGIAICSVDGKLRFSAPCGPLSIASRSSSTTTYAVPGVEPGDLVLCNHSSSPVGMVLSGAITGKNDVSITLANLSGKTVDLLPGVVSIDVWKRL